MNKNINLFKFILFFSIILFTNSKAELNNKIIITVGDEIITNYDMTQEFKYLNVITLGNFKTMNNKEAKRIAEDSLINDKIKVNALANYNNIIIREYITNLQRHIANNINVVCEGRDIGTVVFPFADFKFFLKADIDIRVERRHQQYLKNNITLEKEKIKKMLLDRDYNDINRKVSPLKKANNSIVLDTTYKTIEEQIDIIIAKVK